MKATVTYQDGRPTVHTACANCDKPLELSCEDGKGGHIQPDPLALKYAAALWCNACYDEHKNHSRLIEKATRPAVAATEDFSKEQEAIEALHARGISNALELLGYATPDAILNACQSWDSRKGAGAGLLAKMVRDGGIPNVTPRSRSDELRRIFETYADPVGAAVEPHARLQARQNHFGPACPGQLTVIERTYPLLAVECDKCGFEAVYTISRPPGGTGQ